jgi:membrane complex biogenesis BtpA family protein
MQKVPRLIGVIHLQPLPGAPGRSTDTPVEVLQEVGAQAVEEARCFAEAGYDGIILENFGDAPFYKSQVPPETVASLSIVAAAVREVFDGAIGINVLRNDARAALAIAAVTGCDFIRVNVFSGVAATDQGFIEGEAAFLVRERERLQAPVAILADVHVKHAVTFSSIQIDLAVEELCSRACVDGVIVSGRTTGRLLEWEALKAASRTARHQGVPLYLGSGAQIEHLAELVPWVDGIIVGSALRERGVAGSPLQKEQVEAFQVEYKTILAQTQVKSKKKKKTVKKKSSRS